MIDQAVGYNQKYGKNEKERLKIQYSKWQFKNSTATAAMLIVMMLTKWPK